MGVVDRAEDPASKHKAMSYQRMEEKEEQLQQEVEALLEQDRRPIDNGPMREYG